MKIIVMGRDMQAQLHTYIAQLRPYINFKGWRSKVTVNTMALHIKRKP